MAIWLFWIGSWLVTVVHDLSHSRAAISLNLAPLVSPQLALL